MLNKHNISVTIRIDETDVAEEKFTDPSDALREVTRSAKAYLTNGWPGRFWGTNIFRPDCDPQYHIRDGKTIDIRDVREVIDYVQRRWGYTEVCGCSHEGH